MAKFVHIGFGAFHKAHQSVFLQNLADAGQGDWPITAINLRGQDSAQFTIEAQKPSYTVTTFDEAGARADLSVDRHTTFLDWSLDRTAAEEALADPDVTCVTMTVSEAGYYFDTHFNLDLSHPVIAAEKSGGTGESIYAFLTNALQKRWAANAGPINLMCCDNLRDNGHMLERNLKAYFSLLGLKDLAFWAEGNCTFPCSMVDRITPAPTHIATPADNEGTPVVAESFIQWVIEDKFCAERPKFEAAEGVQLVSSVTPYEETKIRVLNGAHTALCYLGALAGHSTFDEAMADPQLRAHFQAFEDEVQTAMPGDMPLNIPRYVSLIEARFTNKAIADSIARICSDGFAKMGIFIRPTLEGCFRKGVTPIKTIRSLASWFYYAHLVKEGKRDFAYREPNWDVLEALLNRNDLSAFLGNRTLFGDVAELYPSFVQEFEYQLASLEATWPA